MKRFIIIAAALLASAFALSAQQMQTLPNDPQTRVGKLDNGLTYYIRHNDKPAQRAEFYLATNVGALQEEPDQDGLAHFLEHMCFNGTKNFPGKGILNWLESIGASFGGNVNASTGVEQTIYLLNNIPLIRPTVVDTCLLIMHDYSHFVTCDPKEIDSERGVILEEKRSRNDAQWRVREASGKAIYGDTKYATTTVIGSEENLKTFKPESLTNFYHTWYRPDMQALVVVGDIDVDEVEAKIKSTFADIPAAENPKQKDVIAIPGNEEPNVAIITDPELNNSSMTVYWKGEPLPEMMNNTVNGVLVNLLKELIGTVMNERFNDLSADPNAVFIAAGFGTGKVCETMEAVLAQIVNKDGEALSSFRVLMTEVEKMRRYGFTDAEVERAKTEILASYEAAAKRADTRKNSEFVMPMISNFFDNTPFMEPATEYEVVKTLLAQIPSAIINQVAAQMITKDNMVIIYSAPEREGMVHPTADQLKAIVAEVENAEIEQAAGEDIPAELLNAAALKGSKVKTSKPGVYGSIDVTLANGLRVIFLPTDNEKDHISFSIFKKGGRSLISDEDVISFEDNIWALYVQNSGLSSFSSTVLPKMLAGKQLSVSPFINAFVHGVNGSSTVKDFETALQCAYLYFTDPRFDENEYNQGIKQIETVLPNLMNQPQYKLQSELYKVLYNSPRKVMISNEVLEKANLSTLENNYRKLFADAAGATMIIVGDFETEEIVPLIAKYGGSLPKGKKTTSWMDRGEGVVNGTVVRDFKTEMQTPKVTVVQCYNVRKPYSVEAEVAVDALQYILNMIYTETLREEEGGTYGASAYGNTTNEPDASALVQIAFETNTEQADKLRELAVAGFKSVAENGPEADKFDKAVKNLEKSIPESKQTNSFWATALRGSVLYGVDYVNEYEAAVKALTPEKVKACAAEFINSGNFVELVMRPE